MNLIHYNAVEGLAFRRMAPERAAGMAHALYRRGILTKLRNSAGQDVEGGCGQLRARGIRERDPTGLPSTAQSGPMPAILPLRPSAGT